jgi:hypothetical protein
VYVDGVLEATIDCYSAIETYQVPVFTKEWGTSGTHTIRIECTQTKNVASSGYWIGIDAFEYRQ